MSTYIREEGDCDFHADDATRRGAGVTSEMVRAELAWAQEKEVDELEQLYAGELSFLKRFVVGALLSEVGIPPRDRALPAGFEYECKFCIGALAVADVVWLAAQYPDHEPTDARLRDVFDLSAAPTSVALLAPLDPDTLCKRLGLTASQWGELQYFSRLPMPGSGWTVDTLGARS